MNRLQQLFSQRPQNLLNVYFTAGFPAPEATRPILRGLQAGGVDLIEIGMPYSDPVADGETIQQANQQALEAGMSISKLFSQLEGFRQEVSVPVLLMGYLNPVLQFGAEAFCRQCRDVGIDGLILPDLPMQEYETEFQDIFRRHGLSAVFLITPQTAEARIRTIDRLTDTFIYMVSSASTTGAKAGITDQQRIYFDRLQQMQLKNPRLIGFGIADHPGFVEACRYASGAIIGSAFINRLRQATDWEATARGFVREIKQG